MQFSLDKFFEMIESRFGKRAAKALLAVLAVALFVFSLNFIITNGVIPIYLLGAELLRGAEVTLGLRDLIAFFISTILPALSFFVIYQLFMKRMLRSTRETVDEAVKLSRFVLDESMNVVTTDKEKAKLLIEVGVGLEKMFREQQADMQNLLREHKGGVQQLTQEHRDIHTSSQQEIEQSNQALQDAIHETAKQFTETLYDTKRNLIEFVADRTDALEARVSKLEQSQPTTLPATPSAPEAARPTT